MRTLPLTFLLLVACGSQEPPGAAPCVGGMTIVCPCPNGAQGSQTCQSDGRFSTCLCADGGGLDAGAEDIGVDVVVDRPPPPPDRGTVEDVGVEMGADVFDAGTHEDRPQEIDTGHDAGAGEDVGDAPTDVDAGAVLDVRGDAVDVPGDINGMSCATEGERQCADPHTMRLCRGGRWAAIPCGVAVDGLRDECAAPTNACTRNRLASGSSCSNDTQCSDGYAVCLETGCIWGAPLSSCFDDTDCRSRFGASAVIRCATATIYSTAARVCVDVRYDVRPCVHDRQCFTGWRCNYAVGVCVPR